MQLPRKGQNHKAEPLTTLLKKKEKEMVNKQTEKKDTTAQLQ